MAMLRILPWPLAHARPRAHWAGWALLAVLTGVACSRSGPAAGKAREARAVPVTVAQVVRKDVPLEVETFGTAQSKASVTILAKTSQVLQAVHFKEGDAILRGALLFTLDSRPALMTQERARAALARDRVLAVGAQADLRRGDQLLAGGMLAQADFDRLKTQADALTETLKADQTAIDAAQLDVDNCRITAPVAGRAGKVLVHAGNLVTANNLPLVVINQIKPIDVFFSLPQTELGRLRSYRGKGDLDVQVTLPEDPGRPLKGRLAFIDNRVDPGNGTIELGATLPNEDERLWPGRYVRVQLALTVQQDAVVVPRQALVTSVKGQSVFVLKKDRSVEQRPVKVERSRGDDTVIAAGLQAGELVVTDGQLQLEEGSRVEIRSQETMASPATGAKP
jgi:membrane fusion protein, multidrug efflux system